MLRIVQPHTLFLERYPYRLDFKDQGAMDNSILDVVPPRRLTVSYQR